MGHAVSGYKVISRDRCETNFHDILRGTGRLLVWWLELSVGGEGETVGWKKDNDIAGGDISGVRGSQEKGAAVFGILLVAGSHSGWLVEKGAVLWWLTAERGADGNVEEVGLM
ncbi:hypothetical protein Peur_068240 [Populus x canadensis]